jgi:3-dehydroquinate synthase
LGLTDEQTGARLLALLARCGLPTRAPSLTADRYLELMRLDKKARDGEIRFTLLDGRGRAVVRSTRDDLVREVVESAPHGE